MSEPENQDKSPNEILSEYIKSAEDTICKIENIYDSAKEFKEEIDEAAGKRKNLDEELKFATDLKNKLNAKLLEIKNLQDAISKCEQFTKDKVGSIKIHLDNAAKDQEKISNIYYEINGKEENNKHIDGLKDRLKKSFEELENDISLSKQEIEEFTKSYKEEFESYIVESRKIRDGVKEEIRSYLPGAVAAGLAGAYHEKAQFEEKEIKSATTYFNSFVLILSLIGIAPFVYLIVFNNLSFWELIEKVPSITFSIFPIYLPLIWLGIHFNKKANISRKLSEEYSYKEALCKSIDGLQKQIELVSDEDHRQELHRKLVELVIKTSEDNPGKYITQYNKTDNPLVDLILKPKKLRESLSAIQDIKKELLHLPNEETSINSPSRKEKP
ncbi:MAG: hypothetical protein J5934_02495 [Succinivibrio sp.]|nr:hypothetical protein [Succinivibrio sp.]